MACKTVQEVRRALCIRRRGEDGPVIVLQHLDPRSNISGVVCEQKIERLLAFPGNVQQSEGPAAGRVGLGGGRHRPLRRALAICRNSRPEFSLKEGRRASLFAALNIENVEYRAIGCRGPGALRDRIRQQAFQLAKIADLCADMIEMMRGNPANFPA